MDRRVVIVGGGISGLAAARAAVETSRRAGAEMEVVVLERDPAVGGKARTRRRDGWLVEGGPAGYLDDPEATAWRLLSVLDGLTLQVVAHDALITRDDVLAWARTAAARELAATAVHVVSENAGQEAGPAGVSRRGTD